MKIKGIASPEDNRRARVEIDGFTCEWLTPPHQPCKVPGCAGRDMPFEYCVNHCCAWCTALDCKPRCTEAGYIFREGEVVS